MKIELWIYFTGLADSPNERDRENAILLESEFDVSELLEKFPSELLTAEHVFARVKESHIELEVHV